MNGAMRMIALWPQYCPSPSCQKCRPAVNIGPYRRIANWWTRPNIDRRPNAVGAVWMIPASGVRSIARTIATMVLPAMMLSASSTTM
jgi:hypothetical protein